jgi:PAS domain S-box-containing protein
MTTDPLGIISDVNQQMEVLTGYSREHLIGTLFRDYFTDPKRAEEGIRLVLREGRVTNYELTARSKSGKEVVVSYNAVTFNDATGTLQGVFAAARDITEQKKLEQQLREQQTYLRGLIESSVDGLITVDPQGTITDVNDRMCLMSGYNRAELLSTPFADYFTDPGRAKQGVQQTFEIGYVTEYALTLIARSRRQLQVSFNASVFKDTSGNVRGIFASARDITERVRLEEQLRENQVYNRGLIESSVDGLITVDPEGFITDVNEQMCRMTGYTREELIGSAPTLACGAPLPKGWSRTTSWCSSPRAGERPPCRSMPRFSERPREECRGFSPLRATSPSRRDCRHNWRNSKPTIGR